MNAQRALRHREAAQRHLAAAGRHEQQAERWIELGEPERAELARRGAGLERQLAQLENDIAAYYKAALEE